MCLFSSPKEADSVPPTVHPTPPRSPTLSALGFHGRSEDRAPELQGITHAPDGLQQLSLAGFFCSLDTYLNLYAGVNCAETKARVSTVFETFLPASPSWMNRSSVVVMQSRHCSTRHPLTVPSCPPCPLQTSLINQTLLVISPNRTKDFSLHEDPGTH